MAFPVFPVQKESVPAGIMITLITATYIKKVRLYRVLPNKRRVIEDGCCITRGRTKGIGRAVCFRKLKEVNVT